MNFIGKVIRGVQKGRKLGFPTANILIDSEMESGIYAGRVFIEDKKYFSALYCPGGKLIEAFILDFAGDLYEKEIKVEVENKIRERQDFKTIEDARAQIGKDVLTIRKMFQNEKK